MTAETVTTPTPIHLGLRQAFSLFPTGVVAVCALDDDGNPIGIPVNSFTSVSLDPPLVGICVGRTSTTWPVLAGRARLGLSVLGADQGELCRSLASRGTSRFDGAAWQPTAYGAVMIEGAALWLDCELRSSFDGGDHEVVLLEVMNSEIFADVEPLVFHQSRFRELHPVA
ncbi:flavin reductase family protein [Salinibacterium hongtaonis]|uniref:Oxidoreductase n=1 Tax=Homoserinimonas hongtaonis TaxID=2079791 RepID=A0A2U1SY10_9MICO|nr:flavin reductase family protein [Salinibacterium hongtaonis]PWB96515.1 oxidoreductase [Salinibacterium hongtaonis]